MAFTKGHKLAIGRPKGSINKTTASAKEAISAAFEGLGGVPALLNWARQEKNQGIFYGNIWTKILPHEITGGIEIKTPAIVELPPKKLRE